MKLLNNSIVSGQNQITGNGELLRLIGTNHAYMSFYNSGSAGARGGYLGFPGASVTYVSIVNEVAGGHISLIPGTSGNVGIGTNSPGQKLEVNGGNIRVINSSVPPQVFIGSTTTQGIFVRNDHNLGNDYISSVIDSTELAVLTFGRNGVVGSIDVSPNGTTGETRISKGRNNFSTTPYWFFNSSGNLGYWRRDLGSLGWSINETGTLSASSDIRLKTNIRPITYGLKELLDLNPIAYNFINSDKVSLGLNAAELKSLVPEVVCELGVDPAGSGNPLLGVNYSEMIPVLINAIKELSAEVESLKAKIGQ